MATIVKSIEELSEAVRDGDPTKRVVYRQSDLLPNGRNDRYDIGQIIPLYLFGGCKRSEVLEMCKKKSLLEVPAVYRNDSFMKSIREMGQFDANQDWDKLPSGVSIFPNFKGKRKGIELAVMTLPVPDLELAAITFADEAEREYILESMARLVARR